MARTGFWFQWARGRAMVRNRSMQRARYWTDIVTRRAADHGRDMLRREARKHRLDGHFYLWMADEVILATCQRRAQECVRRAREANRDWRRYRARAREMGEIE